MLKNEKKLEPLEYLTFMEDLSSIYDTLYVFCSESRNLDKFFNNLNLKLGSYFNLDIYVDLLQLYDIYNLLFFSSSVAKKEMIYLSFEFSSLNRDEIYLNYKDIDYDLNKNFLDFYLNIDYDIYNYNYLHELKINYTNKNIFSSNEGILYNYSVYFNINIINKINIKVLNIATKIRYYKYVCNLIRLNNDKSETLFKNKARVIPTNLKKYYKKIIKNPSLYFKLDIIFFNLNLFLDRYIFSLGSIFYSFKFIKFFDFNTNIKSFDNDNKKYSIVDNFDFNNIYLNKNVKYFIVNFSMNLDKFINLNKNLEIFLLFKKNNIFL
eukprot:GHVN01059443.1.p1 GENE.GHVN01059443.1~~GHVN01059443.1.p1  ORF type:complete len:322 (-),score=-13.85 GHVN01059443.1:585-1550(-)